VNGTKRQTAWTGVFIADRQWLALKAGILCIHNIRWQLPIGEYKHSDIKQFQTACCPTLQHCLSGIHTGMICLCPSRSSLWSARGRAGLTTAQHSKWHWPSISPYPFPSKHFPPTITTNVPSTPTTTSAEALLLSAARHGLGRHQGRPSSSSASLVLRARPGPATALRH
jgi:hypothetical protein